MPGLQLFNLNQDVMAWAILLTLYAIRPGVAFLVLPATNDPMMTATIRHLLTVVIAFHVSAGGSLGSIEGISSFDSLFMLALRESLIGFTLGFAASKVFWIAQSVGALMDNLAGYNNVQLINPSSSEQNTPVSDVMLQLCGAVFWTTGGMLVFLSALNESYQWWPLLQKTLSWPHWPANLSELQLSQLMRIIVSLALPMLFILAFIDVGLGLVSRAAKNVDTSALSQPLKSATALIAMTLFSAIFLDDIKTYMALGDLVGWLAQWRDMR